MELGVVKIKANDFVGDFQRGMADFELIRKYGLSATQLERVFKRLIDAGSINPVDFEAWQIFHNDSVTLNVRLYPRVILKSLPLIFDDGNPANRGTILNISEYGFGSKGIRGSLNAIMTLRIPAGKAPQAEAFTVHARCKWVRVDLIDGRYRSGFFVLGVDNCDWRSVCDYLRSAEARGSMNAGRIDAGFRGAESGSGPGLTGQGPC